MVAKKGVALFKRASVKKVVKCLDDLGYTAHLDKVDNTAARC